MDDEERVLPNKSRLGMLNVDVLPARQVKAKRNERLAFNFLLQVSAGHRSHHLVTGAGCGAGAAAGPVRWGMFMLLPAVIPG